MITQHDLQAWIDAQEDAHPLKKWFAVQLAKLHPDIAHTLNRLQKHKVREAFIKETIQTPNLFFAKYESYIWQVMDIFLDRIDESLPTWLLTTNPHLQEEFDFKRCMIEGAIQGMAHELLSLNRTAKEREVYVSC